ncbi:MAG: alpha/beta fold hydrolase [Acidimicrobiales bacterium]
MALDHLHVERRDGPARPALVFTHGGGDSWETWSKQLDHFGAARRTVAWDLRGHGRSHAPHDPAYYTRELALADLAAVVESVGAPVVLAGHSLGGYLSIAYALAHPEQVAALVLVATGPGYRDPKARAGWNRMVDKNAAGLSIPAAAAELIKQHDTLVIDRLDQIAAPVLAAVGENDTVFHASTALIAEKAPRSVGAHVIPGAGHHVHRHAAAEVNLLIEGLLAAL